jgi:hypothetical protein
MPAFLTWQLARRLLPYIAIVLGVLALWWWHSGKVSDARKEGARIERDAWETEAARLREIAAQEALQRLQAVNEANTAAAASRVALDALALQTKEADDAYYRANPARNVPCLSDDRLRSIAASDAAARKAATATP